MMTDIAVNRNNGNIYISSIGKVISYNLDGDFLNSFNVNGNNQVCTIDDNENLIFIRPTKSGKNGPVDLISVFTLTGDSVKRISSTTPDGTISVFNWIYTKNGLTYYKEELSDTLMVFGKDYMPKPLARFDFKNLAFTEELFTFEAMNKWTEYYRVFNIFDFKEIMIINAQKGLMGRDLVSLVYDKKRNKTAFIGSKKGIGGLEINGLAHLPVADDGEELICLIPITEVLDKINDVTDKGLKEKISSMTIDSNPLLAFITLKK